MSISWGAQYPKLKTNLQLAIDRLKLMGKKKTELAMKERKERYMVEIAASAGVPFTPDPDVMRDDEVAQAEKMFIDFKQAGTTTNVTDATQPAILPVPPSGGIPPAAPPSDGVNYGWTYYGWTEKFLTYPTLSQRDHLIIAIEKKLDGIRRDVDELKRQQLLKASGSKIPTILKSVI